jgi:amidohydrolase
MNIEKLKKAIAAEVGAHAASLGELSRNIHDNPETSMLEVKASAWLTAFFKENGFKVEQGIYQLPTAFRAVYGKGKPVIAFLAEYDALPKLGHACGHNLIATSAAAAAIGAKKAADELGGSIVVYGTPGEENDAGKAIMANRGAFRDVDAVMITHPGGGNEVIIGALACQTLYIDFHGKAAHAAADPEQGINALEAMILSYNGINSLRQHIREGARIHGIITNSGEAPNIVPEHTAGTFLVRAVDDEYLDLLKERVLNCFKGAAAATGARLEYRWADVRYNAMRNSTGIAKLFQQNMMALGRDIDLGSETSKNSGSTDVGNVSRLVPTIQPMVGIAPDDVLIHSTQFCATAATGKALEIMLDAGRAMAMTAADLLADPQLLAGVKAEFQKGN